MHTGREGMALPPEIADLWLAGYAHRIDRTRLAVDVIWIRVGRVDVEDAIALRTAIHGVKTRGTPTKVVHNFCA